MNLLLDTHVMLWWLFNSPRLGEPAREAIADPQRQVYVSRVISAGIDRGVGVGALRSGIPGYRGSFTALRAMIPVKMRYETDIVSWPES